MPDADARAPASPRTIALAAIGFTLGVSSAFAGLYDPTAGRIVALVTLAALVTLVLIAPAIPRGPALAALGALLFLSFWSLISDGWGGSPAQALEDAHRWLLYALLLGVLLLLLARDRGSGAVLVGAAAAGVLAVGAYDVARMLAGEGSSLFVLSRLNRPLGYTNGQAAYFVLAVWPLLAAAEHARWRAARGVSLAGATLLAALAVLSQSRGALLALVVSAAVLLAVAPGRQRRAWALLTMLGGVLIAAPGMSDVFSAASQNALRPPSDAARNAAVGALLGAVAAGAVWTVGSWATELFGRSHVDRLRLSMLSGTALAALCVAGVIALFVAEDPVARLGDQVDAFRKLEGSTSGQSRLVSGSGNRYDYWRIAVRGFASKPLVGEGAGAYAPRYFRERETTENVRQPHSLELQTLDEKGLIGGIALATFLGAVLLGLWRRLRSAVGPREAGISVAAAGMFLAWLAQTSVDWLHLIPGLTGVALCGAAVGLAPSLSGAEGVSARIRMVGLGAVLTVVVLVSISLGGSIFAAERRDDARSLIASSPAKAIQAANDALKLDPDSLDTYYAKAAAYAQLDRYADARATLLEAARREPKEFVTWGLLGDLAVRKGRLDAAQQAYERGARLNPRDTALARLARDRLLLARLSRNPDLLRGLTPTTSDPSLQQP